MATTSYTGSRKEVASVLHQISAAATILQPDYGYNKVHDRTYECFGAGGSAGDAFVYDKIRRLTNAYMGSTVPTAPAAKPTVKKIDYPCFSGTATTTETARAWSRRCWG